MKHYLPTYEECKKIVEKNSAFYEMNTVIDGYKISVFNYRIAQDKDFICPISENPEIKAHELRGITFIHDGKNVHRNLMLHKFFNLNQSELSQYSNVISYNINRCQKKQDGSMIRFIRLPNGKIVAKTKMDFTNDQCKMAQTVYESDSNLQNFVKSTLDSGLVAIFELVSILNKIVCVYQKTELILLQLREESTGLYLDIDSHNLVIKHGVKTTESETPILSLDQYIELSKTLEDTEGWVLTLSNGQMIKLKTQWYVRLHKLVDSLSKEDELISMVLLNTLDDSLAQIDNNDVRYKYAMRIQKAIADYLVEKEQLVLDIINDYKGDRKAWALKHLKNPFFPNAAQCLGRENIKDHIYNSLNERIKKETYRLEQARSWLRAQDVALEDILLIDSDQ